MRKSISGQERINLWDNDNDYANVENNIYDPSNYQDGDGNSNEENWWSKWGRTNPEGRFNAVSGLANYIESTQRARDLNKARSRADLASTYTGVKYRDKVQAPSITNMVYAYNLAEKKRKNDEARSKRWENIDKLIAAKAAKIK